MGPPGLHPGPPSDLHLRKLDVAEHGDVLYRTYRFDRDPVYFGRTGRNRFDDRHGKFGVLYTACDPYAAFMEVFGQSLGNRSVATSTLSNYGLARLRCDRPLTLIDMTAPGALARMGADNRLTCGAHEISQEWSTALHRHLYKPDGIRYFTRRDPTRTAIAIFDRGPKITVEDATLWMEGSARQLLPEILEYLECDLLETNMRAQKKGPARQEFQGELFDW